MTTCFDVFVSNISVVGYNLINLCQYVDMLCPSCGSEQIKVSNSRPTSRGTQIWRRRVCLKCGFLFTTHEKIDLNNITVTKDGGKNVKYVGAKLYSSIYHAIVGQKRLDRGDAGIIAEKIFDRVEEKIILDKKKLISTEEIRNIVLEILFSDYLGVGLRYLAYFVIDDKKGGAKKIIRLLKRKSPSGRS